LRVVFAGTPEFSVPALDALHAAGHQIVGVYTQPDRPAGRGRKLTPSAVAQRAAELNLATFKPEKLRGDAIEELRALEPDAMVVVAYGLILPQAVLDIPRHGCINIHASLLPRWRGAAPIQRAILAGDRETGVTIMRMDAGLDTGPMLLAERVAIDEETTAGDLLRRLSALGARLIVDALQRIESGALVATQQPAEGATYAHKIDKEEARIDWNLSADEIARRIRGFNPAPVAWSELEPISGAGAERIRIFAAKPLVGRVGGEPGSVLDVGDRGVAVACADGALLVTELQRPGGKPIAAKEAVRGWHLEGRRFR
jgi:methionyl-tRNA formyltransferase